MLSRSAPFALLAVLFLPVTGNAPVTLKYKVSQHFSQTIDLTMMGQEPQTNTADYDSYVTIVSADSAGGHALTVTVDSIISAPGSNPQIVDALTAQLKGASGSGYVNGAGDASGFPTSVQGGALRSDRDDRFVHEDERIDLLVRNDARRQRLQDVEPHHRANVGVFHEDNLALQERILSEVGTA